MRNVILLSLLAAFLSLGATNAVAEPEPASTTRASTELQIAVLKAQLDAARDFHEKILSTVYWSLGTVAGLAALIVGYQWFSIGTLYKRDKSVLRQALGRAAAWT